MATIKGILRDLGVSQVFQPGFEADDIIATLVQDLEGDKLIVTNDKDLFQLIDFDVHILKPVKKGYDIITSEVFEEENEYSPSELVYVRSLAGDSSDNIQGVKGIGPKNALALFEEHGNALKKFITGDIEKMKGTKSRLLNKSVDDIRTAYKLMTFKISENPTYLNGKIKETAVKNVFKDCGFKKFSEEKKFSEIILLGS